jgi:hypothetical protein
MGAALRQDVVWLDGQEVNVAGLELREGVAVSGMITQSTPST